MGAAAVALKADQGRRWTGRAETPIGTQIGLDATGIDRRLSRPQHVCVVVEPHGGNNVRFDKQVR